ncbi:hypothetical protein MAPG_07538 [Magnaporthiopsis poae ATCC 64411]|uniref:Uncharacterized protein n=1 Tax=Magnaporthiopsis poae (strain ATCC 64411 / 73-15) TaxID=644358 RepID=A0A0C4E4Y2_MAGP6|nr:hypothetical protein MAPG_07538 [Magnaporthiopsis poae ATCC 64411]
MVLHAPTSRTRTSWMWQCRDRDEKGTRRIYDKIRVREERDRDGAKDRLKRIWPVGGLYGIYKSIQSGDYHLYRKAESSAVTAS